VFKRVFVGVCASLALIVALSGTVTAAEQLQVITLKDECSLTGGAHGNGFLHLKIKVREVGVSGVNYFVIKSSAGDYYAPGGYKPTWYKWPKETSSNFADDSVTHYRNVDRRFDFPASEDYPEGSIRMIVSFMSNTHGVVKTMVVDSDFCF